MTQPSSKNNFGKWMIRLLVWPLVGFLVLVVISIIWILALPHPKGPLLKDHSHPQLTIQNDSTTTWKNNWAVKSESGHYIVYVEGSPEEMGLAQGILTQDLIKNQEIAFTDEIKRLIPSPKYLSFLQYFVKILNKDLEHHVIPIYQTEIKAIAEYADPSFQWIGPNYARLLNYHAAHDVGHALQSYMLVGCTSFATWNKASENDHLLVGRNFDFYVGEAFAKEKILLLAKPDQGHSFLSVTWGGFIGVVSGLNSEGLSVTINAAPSDIPFAAATPVSLVAREVLQFASNVEEALAIIEKRKMFVSETFLIGSAQDQKAVLIEKTPNETVLITTSEDFITCTNHYQSEDLKYKNTNTLDEEATWYRHLRTHELLEQTGTMNPLKAAAILRDFKGLENSNIGLGNEMAINQFIAHHSVVMDNTSQALWLSTSPWQLGVYQYYSLPDLLNKGWRALEESHFQSIPADSFASSSSFTQFENYYQLQLKWKHKTWKPKSIQEIEVFISNNNNYFHTWELAGDMANSIAEKEKAHEYYSQALILKIANSDERLRIQNKLNQLMVSK